jgi:hypothetical protein
MARGNSRAESELSESLRRKALSLRVKNEAERQEAEANQKDYDDTLKVAYMRAEEETDEEFRGKRMEVDDAEQAKREREAAEAQAAAEAEEAREAAENAKNDDLKTRISDDLENHKSLSYEDWTGASWYRTIESSDNPEIRKLEPSLWAADEDRRYLTDDYIDKSVAAAPAGIRESVKKAMECWRANGRVDSFPGQRAEKLYAGLTDGYDKGSKGTVLDGKQGPVVSGKRVGTEGTTPELHEAGLKTADKTDAYIAKVLKGAGNHITDVNGKLVR